MTTLPAPRARRRQKLNAHAAAVRERENQAIRLRTAHLTYEQIAAQVGYANASAAQQAIFRGLRRVPAEEGEQIRQVEYARLDRWAQVAASMLFDVNRKDTVRLAALDRLLRVSEMRMRYAGLLAPASMTEVNVGVQVNATSVEARVPAAEALVRDDPERLFRVLDAFARAGKIGAEGGLGIMAIDAAAKVATENGAYPAAEEGEGQ